jgi:hypothetical protein
MTLYGTLLLIVKQTGIIDFMDRLDILSTYLVVIELTDAQKATILYMMHFLITT